MFPIKKANLANHENLSLQIKINENIYSLDSDSLAALDFYIKRNKEVFVILYKLEFLCKMPSQCSGKGKKKKKTRKKE